MKKIMSIVILSLFYIGFKERLNTFPDASARQNLYTDSLFKSAAQQFALLYPEDFELDSNTLIFYGTRPFDTSFFLQLKAAQNEILGFYYEVLPAYHTETNSYANETNKLLFFEGYSFALNLSNWQKITDQTKRLLADSISLNLYDACRDCAFYGLSYNKKKNIGNNLKYGGFYRYLKDLFLSDFIKKRKPIIIKEQYNGV